MPAAQAVQIEMPVVPAKRPTGQFVQVVEPVAIAYKPAKHATHPLAASIFRLFPVPLCA